MRATGSAGLMPSAYPIRAPAGICSASSSWEPGLSPRARMSSVNEVSSMDLAMGRWLTNVPAP
jgi:hypothetical protein